MNNNVLLIMKKDCEKLKNVVLDNNLIFNATREQEEYFYSIIDSLISRLEDFIAMNKGTLPINSYENFLFKKEQLTIDTKSTINYDLDKMRINLLNYYNEFKNIRDNETNFIAIAYMIALSPLEETIDYLIEKFA